MMNDTVVKGIYKIISPTGKVYIGQSHHIYQRWYRGYNGSYNRTPIEKSIRKYGALSHIFSIEHQLPVDVDQSTMDNYEILYMDLYKSCGLKMLNIREGGSKGKCAEETKIKLSSYVRTPETRAKMKESQKNKKPCSEETKMKIALSGMGRMHSEESKRKIGDSNKRHLATLLHHPNLGKTKSKEARNKQSLALKGKYKGENAAWFGRRHTPETIKKMSEWRSKYWAEKRNINNI